MYINHLRITENICNMFQKDNKPNAHRGFIRIRIGTVPWVRQHS